MANNKLTVKGKTMLVKPKKYERELDDYCFERDILALQEPFIPCQYHPHQTISMVGLIG